MSSPTELPPPLDARAFDPDPHAQFATWFAHAAAAGVHEPEAVALATADADGRPSARMVLLRGHGPEGYLWFTNAESRKGHDLEVNPRAALVAHWAAIGRQVRIEGRVVRAPSDRSDEYFAGRDRGSQLGAWASHQSATLRDREELIDRLDQVTRRFGDGPIPRPPHWGGYLLVADRLEFWQHGDHRLHDRLEYLGGPGDAWTLRRLSP